MFNLDLLISFIEKTNNKILFVYWPDIKNEYQKIELQKRNFFKALVGVQLFS